MQCSKSKTFPQPKLKLTVSFPFISSFNPSLLRSHHMGDFFLLLYLVLLICIVRELAFSFPLVAQAK